MTHPDAAMAPTAMVSAAVGTDASRAMAIANSLTPAQWNELTDEILRRLERRVADDAARRGRRHQLRAV